MAHGVTDRKAGGQYYFDAANKLFWTWDTPELITAKFDAIVRKYKLGGVMAWSLGEDSFDWSHIRAMAKELAKKSAPKPAPKPAPVVRPAPASTASKSPYSVVFADGTPQGPESDLASQPIGAPSDFTQQADPSEAEASTPQQNEPIAPAQVAAPQASPTDSDLPFSPEYLNLMGRRRLTRRERMNLARDVTSAEATDLSDLSDLPDMDDITDLTDLTTPSTNADLTPSPSSKKSTHATSTALPHFKLLGDLEPLGDDDDNATQPLGEVLGTGWIWALKKRVLEMLW
jgi:hypothetical protein